MNNLFKIYIIGATAWWIRHWIPNLEVPCLKPLGGSKMDSAFHPSEIDKVSTRNFGNLVVKSKLPP